MSNEFWYCINAQLKERAEKLENWKMKEMRREEKKKEKNELLRRQSSLWIEEPELEKKMLEAVVDIRQLWVYLISYLSGSYLIESRCIQFFSSSTNIQIIYIFLLSYNIC